MRVNTKRLLTGFRWSMRPAELRSTTDWCWCRNVNCFTDCARCRRQSSLVKALCVLVLCIQRAQSKLISFIVNATR